VRAKPGERRDRALRPFRLRKPMPPSNFRHIVRSRGFRSACLCRVRARLDSNPPAGGMSTALPCSQTGLGGARLTGGPAGCAILPARHVAFTHAFHWPPQTANRDWARFTANGRRDARRVEALLHDCRSVFAAPCLISEPMARQLHSDLCNRLIAVVRAYVVRACRHNDRLEP
jgi:hypothetical protein